ncbi:MAG TPA: ATP-dependent DNA helicase UvrD2 [Acidimicrobiales bacterium]|nr:ATP-dependent DNA helicase UvrD2 [Acidimicrobiales bacterium]
MSFTPPLDEILSGLTDAQVAAVTSEAQPLCVVASAGSGKTRVLTRRIAYRIAVGSASPVHSLSLTFTRKAAGELQSRLRALGMREHVSAGTFHALASAQLQRWWADRRKQPPVLLERKARVLGPLVSSRPGLAGASLSDLAGHIEWAKARLVSPEDFEAAAHEERRQMPAGARAADIAALYARYEHEKLRRGLVDFDDLLSQCAAAIESDPQFAGAQRWKWRHLFVDEFQDLNPLQHRLLLAWLGTSDDLFVVGDPNQAIYGWNGADPSLLAGFSRRWPQGDVVHLDHNHRCTPQVVAAAARVLGPAGDRLRSAGEEGPEPRVRSFASDAAEARGIAAELVRAHDAGRPWTSMAVLTRTNAQLVTIGDALEAAGVPFWAPGRKALLQEPITREVMRWAAGEGGRSLQTLAADLEDLAGGEDRVGLRMERSLDEVERSAVSALAGLARAFQRQDTAATARQWLSWLPTALRDDAGPEGPRDAVTLCSFHRAKGLEWEAVWVAGLEAGLVPIARAAARSAGPAVGGRDHQLAEERRLLYVALTRAARELHCSWARTRTFGSRPVPREPSAWLDAVCPGAASAGDPARRGPAEVTTAEWRRRIREQRERLAGQGPAHDRIPHERPQRRSAATAIRLPDPDQHTVDALRSWRSETARASGVPAYVVMHDTTLKALASLRPANLDELLTVPGLGPIKADRYGPALLALVADQAATA